MLLVAVEAVEAPCCEGTKVGIGMWAYAHADEPVPAEAEAEDADDDADDVIAVSWDSFG